jgi:hypothetical protein
MVHRWRCRNCEFSTWAPGRDQTVESAKSHLVKHYRDKIYKEDFGLAWSCPYCEATGRSHDSEEAFDRFKDHLFGHVEPLLESGVHVADDVNGTGSILVNAPLESTGADSARLALLTPADICIFVTTNPERRLELIDEKFPEWPALTIVVTTKSQPLAGIEGIDFSAVPIEVVQLDKSLGLSSLGETVSRVLGEYESAEGKVSLEFDIIAEIIEKFELQDVFKFMHVFTSRCKKADALSHYYLDPKAQSESTINLLSQVFDMTLHANGTLFESRP